MVAQTGKLHLLSGKIASGKSTLARQLADQDGTVRINEDRWLSVLYEGEMHSLSDYVARAARLRAVMGPHVVELLRSGVSVVLDFPANTRDFRAWMKHIIDEAGCDHALHVLDTPEALCRERLKQRNESGLHEFRVTEEQFDLFSQHYQPPEPDEGFTLVVHRP